MKIRQGFVSNSSSSSFIVAFKGVYMSIRHWFGCKGKVYWQEMTSATASRLMGNAFETRIHVAVCMCNECGKMYAVGTDMNGDTHHIDMKFIPKEIQDKVTSIYRTEAGYTEDEKLKKLHESFIKDGIVK